MDATPKTSEDVSPTLRVGGEGGSNLAVVFAQNTRDEVRVQRDGTISGALSAQPGMKQTTYIEQPTAFKYSAGGAARTMPAYDDSSTPTLVTEKPPATAYAVRMRAGCAGGGKGPLVQEGVSGTLATGNDQTLFQPVDFRHSEVGDESDATQTLQAKSTGGYSLNYMPGATNGYVVRRMTPLECERLQGMPDDHTRVPYRDKPAEECPDGPRYKAIGNSMAVPVMRWIGERLQQVDELDT